MNRQDFAAAPELGFGNPDSFFASEPANARTIGGLFNDMMVAAGEFGDDDSEADPKLAEELETRLHDTLKANHLGEFFNFAGMVISVDEHTPPGKVRRHEVLDARDFDA